MIRGEHSHSKFLPTQNITQTNIEIFINTPSEIFVMKDYYVYIIEGIRTSKKNRGRKIFYTGFTDDPQRRLREHRGRVKSNFMKINRIIPKRFVYLESVNGQMNALIREREIKKMSYSDKLKLIKEHGG